MPTVKQRVNITIEATLYKTLQKVANRKHKSVSAVSKELIEKALELEEDLYFSRVGDERLENAAERVPHDSVWNDV